MKILMLGNSFTMCNDVPKLVAGLLQAEAEMVARGGSYLHQRLDPQDELCAQTKEALAKGGWDYVVLQDMSNNPALNRADFLNAAGALCEEIRKIGAKPVFYATWAYKEGSAKLASVNMSYDEMFQKLYDAYHEAGERYDALVADVGLAFSRVRDTVELHVEDGFHASPAGSLLAAAVIARTIEEDAKA